MNRKVDNVKAKVDRMTTLPERFQGTVVERWAKYWKFLVKDYSEVVINVVKDSYKNPVKALAYGGTGTVAYHCAIRNPDNDDFVQAIREYENEMAALPETMQNPAARNHLISIERLYADRTIRRLNLGVASIFWRHDHNPELKTYKANCSYVSPDWLAFRERIVEVGFLNEFWILNKEMKDYDVNN